MKGRKSRELALRALYQLDVGKGEPQQAFAAAVATAEADQDPGGPAGTEQAGPAGAVVDEGVLSFAERLFSGVTAHQQEVDGWIGGLARGWDLGRMAAIDRNLLRLAAYELVYRTDVPAAVIINEAVELAKLYSTAESGKFVNGILSALAAHLPGRLPARPRAEEDSQRVSSVD